jgi:membrane associated rhomboid family serine protease
MTPEATTPAGISPGPDDADLAPWMRAHAFPAPPGGADYGYRRGNRNIPAGLDRLRKVVGRKAGRLSLLVWRPGDRVMRTPFELQETLEYAASGWVRLVILAGAAITVALVAHAQQILAQWSSSGLVLTAASLVIVAGVAALMLYLSGRWVVLALNRDPLFLSHLVGWARFAGWQRLQPAGWSAVILIVLVAVYLVQAFASAVHPHHDQIYMWAVGSAASAVISGEWWRMLTSIFLHTSAAHLFANLFTMAFFGRTAEVLAPRGLVPVLFMSGGFAGGCLGLPFLGGLPAAGASGGVSALLGYLIVTAFLDRTRLPAGMPALLLTFAVADLALGMTDPYSHNSAHVGGLLVGATAGVGGSAGSKRIAALGVPAGAMVIGVGLLSGLSVLGYALV